MEVRRDALKTLIGVIMIKISTGVITVWGSLNLYILSYFSSHGESITPLTNSLVVLAVIIPTSLIILFATKLSNRFGYERMIRICAIFFLISPQLINISFTLPVFTFGCVFMPASMFALSSIPIINSLWTQFPQMKNKATSIAVFSFGFGSICWNFLFTITVNPNNVEATVKNMYGMLLFGPEVTDHVFGAIKYGYLFCGTLFVIGSLLVTKNRQYYEIYGSAKQKVLQQFSKRQSLNQVASIQVTPETLQLLKESLESQPEQKDKKSFKDALFSKKFISVFLINLFTGMYQIFVNLNIKLIYIPIVNNDHFLAYCAISTSTIGILGAFFWGFIGDKKGFYISLAIFTAIDLIIKAYGCFAETKITIFIMFILLGLTDKGMLTIMGPGLVEMFGLETATQLLPFKGLSIFLGYLFTPILYIIFSSLWTPIQFLKFLLLFSFVSTILAYKLRSMK